MILVSIPLEFIWLSYLTCNLSVFIRTDIFTRENHKQVNMAVKEGLGT